MAKYCIVCGNKLPDAARFCAKCGTVQVYEDGTEVEMPVAAVETFPRLKEIEKRENKRDQSEKQAPQKKEKSKGDAVNKTTAVKQTETVKKVVAKPVSAPSYVEEYGEEEYDEEEYDDYDDYDEEEYDEEEYDEEVDEDEEEEDLKYEYDEYDDEDEEEEKALGSVEETNSSTAMLNALKIALPQVMSQLVLMSAILDHFSITPKSEADERMLLEVQGLYESSSTIDDMMRGLIKLNKSGALPEVEKAALLVEAVQAKPQTANTEAKEYTTTVKAAPIEKNVVESARRSTSNTNGHYNTVNRPREKSAPSPTPVQRYEERRVQTTAPSQTVKKPTPSEQRVYPDKRQAPPMRSQPTRQSQPQRPPQKQPPRPPQKQPVKPSPNRNATKSNNTPPKKVRDDYYDDVEPIDEGATKPKMEKEVLVRVGGIIGGALIIIIIILLVMPNI